MPGSLPWRLLARGDPPWLQRAKSPVFSTIGEVVRAYLGICKVPDSTLDLLDTVVKDIGTCHSLSTTMPRPRHGCGQ